MSESLLGCAQNPDGSLREASQIQFFNDVDDEHPISGPPSASSSALHPFFTGKAHPVGIVAGSRRSTRKPRPSARLADPDNAEGSTSSGKRKLSAAPRSRKAAKISRTTVVQSSDDDEPASESDDAALGDDTEADDTEGQDAMDVEQYNSIKVMADADHAHVSPTFDS